MNTMLAALNYLRLGYSVIPLKPLSKEPLIPWLDYTKRLATETEISKWFSMGSNNLGIVNGDSSGFDVLDVDGKIGADSIRPLKVSSNMIAKTGKGIQYMYRATGQRPNATQILPSVDIRGEHGYIVAPPSIHPNGRKYIWVLGPVKSHLLQDFPSSIETQAHVSDGSTTRKKSL